TEKNKQLKNEIESISSNATDYLHKNVIAKQQNVSLIEQISKQQKQILNLQKELNLIKSKMFNINNINNINDNISISNQQQLPTIDNNIDNNINNNKVY